MCYSVKLTPNAIEQLQTTMEYISKDLRSPQTASAWADHLEKEISALASLPMRFPLIDAEPWKAKGIRRMPVKNFIVYYWVNEDDKTVWITAVVYARRDQLNALMEMPKE